MKRCNIISCEHYDPNRVTSNSCNLYFHICNCDRQPQESNTYTFRGPINIAHIVSDCMRDGKQAFLAIGDEVVMGVSKQLSVPFPYMGFLFNDCEESKGSPFFYGVINKNDIPKAIKFLKDIDKKIKKEIRTIAKQIAKDKKAGKFSNAPETKVLTF
jgi:hypothetical protein